MYTLYSLEMLEVFVEFFLTGMRQQLLERLVSSDLQHPIYNDSSKRWFGGLHAIAALHPIVLYYRLLLFMLRTRRRNQPIKRTC